MTEEKRLQIVEFYKKEFPADMSLSRMAEKMDALNNHPDIQELRKLLWYYLFK